MRPLMTVRIHGVAFKAAIGSKRAQVLADLQHLAGAKEYPLILVATVSAVLGVCGGILIGWGL